MNFIKRIFGVRVSSIIIFKGKDIYDVQREVVKFIQNTEKGIVVVKSVSSNEFHDNSGNWFVLSVAYDFFPNKN